MNDEADLLVQSIGSVEAAGRQYRVLLAAVEQFFGGGPMRAAAIVTDMGQRWAIASEPSEGEERE